MSNQDLRPVVDTVINELQGWSSRYTCVVQSAVLTVGCALGFQLTNASMEEDQNRSFTPATIKVASDHLEQLLRDQCSRLLGEKVKGEKKLDADGRLERAVVLLHHQYFGTHSAYGRWEITVHAKDNTFPFIVRPTPTTDGGRLKALKDRLVDLALFFLIWTEASSLRHTPELLYLLYCLARNSQPFRLASQLMEQSKDAGPVSLQYWFDQPANALPFEGVIWPRLIDLRNEASRRISAPRSETRERKAYAWDTLLVGCVGGGVQGHPGKPDFIWRQSSVVVTPVSGASPVPRQVSALEALRRQQQEDAGRVRDDAVRLERMLEAMLQLFGDGCIFLNLVLQPLFCFVAEQINLMGEKKEEAALRVGYDDINESASSIEALKVLSFELSPGGRELCPLDMAWEQLVHKAYSTELPPNTGIPDLGTSEDGRYPRDAKRLAGLNALMPQQQVPHVGKALMVMHRVWSKVFRKTFIETRSLGAVWVAFNRLYVLHAMMLCCMCLWAYFIPNWTIANTIENSFWTNPPKFPGVKDYKPFSIWGEKDNYTPAWEVLVYCAACSLVVHAFIHATKNLMRLTLLSKPSAMRGEGSYRHKIEVDRHSSAMVKSKALIDLVIWLVVVALLLDAYIQGPLAKRLQQAIRFVNPAVPGGIPYWALVSLIYIGARGFIKMSVMGIHLLPRRARECLMCGLCARRADDNRNADFIYKYRSLRASQGSWRFTVNMLMWLAILIVKFLFDFFVVIRPIATGPVWYLIDRASHCGAEDRKPITGVCWSDIANTSILVFALFFSSAMLVWYDTGLFYQLFSATYSVLLLAVPRRVGLIKDWTDLVFSFPRLPALLQKTLLPEPENSEHALQDRHFAHAWNGIVDDLRQRDLLTDTEAKYLRYEFVSFTVAGTAATSEVLLPRIVAAGKISDAKEQRAVSLVQKEVMESAWKRLGDVLRAMGLMEREVLTVIEGFAKERGLQEMGELLIKHKEKFVKLQAEVPVKETWVGFARDVKVQVFAVPKKAWSKPLAEVTLKVEADEATGGLQSTYKGTLKLKAGTYLKTLIVDNIPVIDEELSVTADWTTDKKDLLKPLLEDLLRYHYQRPRRGQDAGTLNPMAQMSNDVQGMLDRMHMPQGDNRVAVAKVLQWLVDAMNLDQGSTFPSNSEAQRVLCFWASSLNNPAMPAAPDILDMPSMTTLTPHYGEDVLYGLDPAYVRQLLKGKAPGKVGDETSFLINSQGEETETLKYLRICFKEDWANLIQRLRAMEAKEPKLDDEGGKVLARDPAHISASDFRIGKALQHYAEEVLVWASMRGQLLTRTVKGMMYYEDAVRQLCVARLGDKIKKAVEAKSLACPPEHHAKVVSLVLEKLTLCKYQYVVSSQVLGELQFAGDLRNRWLADSIRYVLLRRFPNLRIAYIDTENVPAPRRPEQYNGGKGAKDEEEFPPRNRTKDRHKPELLRQYSVLLVKGKGSIVLEKYRVRLPINIESGMGVICGEGKPENQNHAIIFCHSETVQTIDCNQDGYLAEALKLPNLLAEFKKHKQVDEKSPLGPALVGFREWVFSEDSGALAEFAAATERSFGTTVQRVMHNPGGVRFHYGHPDVWDKQFTMTNGGVSKSNKGLHVSEDVFGGYNVMLRGRDITYVDFHSVGKGRDMGFETINGFESKIAAGNGEQVMSRDVLRLGQRMNIWRLMSWYHSGNGFFINTALLMFSLLVNAFVLVLLALSALTQEDPVMRQNLEYLGVVQLMQLGSLSLLVYILTVWCEEGLIAALHNVAKQALAGSMLFYIFRSQTSAASFSSDLRFGGAAYVATGRGYKLKATDFVVLFQQYARSHMWFGGHLLLLLVIALVVGIPGVGFWALWASWLVVLGLLVAPFWFNPFAFDWSSNKVQAKAWLDWMFEYRHAGRGRQLWREWNEDQLAKLLDKDGKQLGRKGNCLWGLFWTLPAAVIIGYAVANMFPYGDRQIEHYLGIIVVVGVNLVLGVLLGTRRLVRRLAATTGASVFARVCNLMMNLLLMAGAVTLFGFIFTRKYPNLPKIVAKVVLVEFELARLISSILIAFFPKSPRARRFVDRVAWFADMALGLLMLLVLFVGSLFGILTKYQATVLFSAGYAASYLTEKSLKGTEVDRISQEIKALQKREKLKDRKQVVMKDEPARPPAWVPNMGRFGAAEGLPQTPAAAGEAAAATVGAGGALGKVPSRGGSFRIITAPRGLHTLETIRSRETRPADEAAAGPSSSAVATVDPPPPVTDLPPSSGQ